MTSDRYLSQKYRCDIIVDAESVSAVVEVVVVLFAL